MTPIHLYVACCILPVANSLVCVVCCEYDGVSVGCMLCAVYRMLRVVCSLSSIVCCMLYVVRYSV